MSELIDLPRAASLICMSESWLRKAVADGRVPYVKLGRAVRFDTAKLLSWIQAHSQKGTST